MDMVLPLLLQPRTPWPWARIPWAISNFIFIQPSRDAQQVGARSQDAIGLYNKNQTYIAVVSDGVSQSFFGDFAAWVLTEHLLSALSRFKPSDSFSDTQLWIQWGLNLSKRINERYSTLKLPAELSPMMRRVLQEKRRLGSETMFAAIRLDLPTSTYPQGRLVLLYAGNVRLRLWGRNAGVFEASLDETRRWSTRWGFIRPPQLAEFPLRDEYGRWLWDGVVIYTDGIPSLDKNKPPWSFDMAYESARSDWASPSSDDQSYVELRWNLENDRDEVVLNIASWPQTTLPLASPIPRSADFNLQWNMPKEGLYSRVHWLDADQQSRLWTTPENNILLPPQARQARVQIVDTLGRPTAWSTWVDLENRAINRASTWIEQIVLIIVSMLLLLYTAILIVKGYNIHILP